LMLREEVNLVMASMPGRDAFRDAPTIFAFRN
jgi:hypothetical protein